MKIKHCYEYRSPLFSFTLTHKNMQIHFHANQAYDILEVLLYICFFCWSYLLGTMLSFGVVYKFPKYAKFFNNDQNMASTKLRLPVQVINWIIMNSRACETMLFWLFHPIRNYFLPQCVNNTIEMYMDKCMGKLSFQFDRDEVLNAVNVCGIFGTFHIITNCSTKTM